MLNKLLSFIADTIITLFNKLEKKADIAHVHNYAGSDTPGGVANSAKKLETPRTLGISGGGFSPEIKFDGSGNRWLDLRIVYDHVLQWGKAALNGDIGLIEKSMSTIHSANRFALCNPNGVTIEYSKDGSLWTDYGANNTLKTRLFTDLDGALSPITLGGKTSSYSSNDKLRITIDSDKIGVYTLLRKLLINVSTNGHNECSVTVEIARANTPTQYESIGVHKISGWSGWNSIPINVTYGGYAENRYKDLRLTFSAKSYNASYQPMQILNIIALGDTTWRVPNEMSRSGRIYNYDTHGNVQFPGNVNGQYLTGTWLQTTANTHSNNQAEKIAMIDSSGWIYHRTANEIISDIGAAKVNHSHTKDNITNFPTKLSQFENDNGYQTSAQMNNSLSRKLSILPGTIDDVILQGAFIGYDVAFSIQEQMDMKANSSDLPKKVSQLANDSEFQTSSQVNNAIATAVGNITGFDAKVVTILPSSGVKGVIYMTPAKNPGTNQAYDEHIWVNNKWEYIGTTAVDLSEYIKSNEVTTLLNDKSDKTHTHIRADITNFPTKLSEFSNDSGYQTVADVANAIRDKASKNHSHTKSEITDFPTTVSSFINDKGYQTAADVSNTIATKAEKAHTHSKSEINDFAHKHDASDILNLSIPQGGGAGVDYVMDQGTYTDGWNYTKWNNGKIELDRIVTSVRLDDPINYGTFSAPWWAISHTLDMSTHLTFVTSATVNCHMNGMMMHATVNPTLYPAKVSLVAMAAYKLSPTDFENVLIRITGYWK